MLMNNLPELENIIDDIKFDNTKFYNEEEFIDIYETSIHIMEEFIEQNPKIITEPDFDELFDENIYELMHSQFDFDIFYTDEVKEEVEEIIEYAKEDFFKNYIPPRSYEDSIILYNPDYDYIKKQINYLRSKPQPTQRTKEWYEFRRNLITASNAYKAFENDSMRNNLIYEKCKNIDTDNNEENEVKSIVMNKMINVNSTLHWGQKYEPVSVKLYETIYNTKIEEFGCIQDDKYKFLGASPDGINIDINSLRYGRMLEIKNIVNREINGVPKKEYWIQMQLQMYVCKLNECDFLETQFIEYENMNDYWKDDSDKRKGVIMYFHTKDGSPYYKYMPLDIVSYKDVNKWQEEMVDKYQADPYNYIWIKDYYWKLEKLSCVLVTRNEKWFNDNINELIELWDIIEKERVTDFEHRSPKKRIKKTISDVEDNSIIKCLLIPNNQNDDNIIDKDKDNNNINSNSRIIYIDTSKLN
jgi:putative phage-type endonuclease